MSPIEFFDYTFLKGRTWLLFGMFYGAYLVAMAGALLLFGPRLQHGCDSFLIANHFMDPGLNRYYRSKVPADDTVVSDARRIGCNVVTVGTEGGKEIVDVLQISRGQIIVSRWFLSLTLGGLFVILVAHYFYCVYLKARERQQPPQRLPG